MKTADKSTKLLVYVTVATCALMALTITILIVYKILHDRQADDSVPNPTPTIVVTVTPTLEPSPTNTPTPQAQPTTLLQAPTTTPTPTPMPQQGLKMMKDVGEAYMDHFGLTEADFQNLVDHDIDLIEGNFDICAYDEDVEYFLDMSQKYGIKVVMNAGSGEAEWGYECDVNWPKDQKPVWLKAKVQAWVNKWKSYPAVYAWDTSNEAGLNFPNSNGGKNTSMYLTLDQLKTAYADVKAADPNHPVMIRMIGWVFYENDGDYFSYSKGNPYAVGVADIVMINAYSNVDDYYPDFVPTVLQKAHDAITAITPNVKFIVALGAWQDTDIFVKPPASHLQMDISAAEKTLPNALAIGFFKYGAENSEWYMPDATIGAPDLYNVIKNY